MTAFLALSANNLGFTLNGAPFQPIGLRMSNSLTNNSEKNELIANMDLLNSYGVNTYSVFIQGSAFGDIKGYNEDTTLNSTYAARLSEIIEAADARGDVVIVGCLYYGTSKSWWPSWGQTEANQAIANTVQWLSDHQYYNVIIDVDNEHMSPFDDAQLIAAGQAVNPTYVFGASGADTPHNAEVALHHNGIQPGIPYIESEGYPHNEDYWGDFSQDPGVYNWTNVGVYTDGMKADVLAYTDYYLSSGHGYLLGSTWLQAAPPSGPNSHPDQ
jgi:hypothetical protein